MQRRIQAEAKGSRPALEDERWASDVLEKVLED